MVCFVGFAAWMFCGWFGGICWCGFWMSWCLLLVIGSDTRVCGVVLWGAGFVSLGALGFGLWFDLLCVGFTCDWLLTSFGWVRDVCGWLILVGFVLIGGLVGLG